jgi:1-phosphofructokinase family hexose kinase
MNNKGYFLTVCLNPTLQKTILLDRLKENEVNRSPEHYLDASGKGINVSRFLNELGEDVIHITQAGGWNRELFLGLSTKAGIDVRWVESGSEIRFCYTVITMEDNTTTEIVEEADPVDGNTEKLVIEQFESLLENAHTVIISGSKAKGFSDTIFPRMVREAKAAHKLVIVDIRGQDLIATLPFSPDIAKPNTRELSETFFRDELSGSEGGPSKERVCAKMTEVYERFGTSLVVTSGKEPCLFMDNGTLKKADPPLLIPVNTTGGGDAFCAGFAQAYAFERDMEKAVIHGIECATLAVATVRPGIKPS